MFVWNFVGSSSLPVSLLAMFMMDWRAEAHFLNSHPKGWDAAGPLVADVAGSAKGVRFLQTFQAGEEKSPRSARR